MALNPTLTERSGHGTRVCNPGVALGLPVGVGVKYYSFSITEHVSVSQVMCSRGSNIRLGTPHPSTTVTGRRTLDVKVL